MIDFKNKKVLSFFAHPDDETLAAGGTFAMLSRSCVEVHVAIPGMGLARRNKDPQDVYAAAVAELRDDCKKALGILGIPSRRIYFGEFTDNQFDTHPRLELVRWLEDLIEKVKPDIIFTHHRYCTNIDHQYCHEAAAIATRPGVGNQITLLSGEVPSATGYIHPVQWEPNLYIEITKEDLKKKIRTMQAYPSEARPDPHPRSPEVLEAYAKVRGSDSGCMWAEAFMVQRTFHLE